MGDAPDSRASRPPGLMLPAALLRHLGSRDVARVVYGAIVGLALVLALEKHPPGAGTTAGLIVATAVAVGLAEAYAEFVGAEARTRRMLTRAEVRRLAGDAAAVVGGAGFPAVFFVLAALDVFATRHRVLARDLERPGAHLRLRVPRGPPRRSAPRRRGAPCARRRRHRRHPDRVEVLAPLNED